MAQVKSMISSSARQLKKDLSVAEQEQRKAIWSELRNGETVSVPKPLLEKINEALSSSSYVPVGEPWRRKHED